MGSRGWHRCLPTPAEGGSEAEGAVVARRRRKKGKELPPGVSQYLESIWAAGCRRELQRLAARLSRVIRVQFEIKGMHRQQPLCLAHL